MKNTSPLLWLVVVGTVKHRQPKTIETFINLKTTNRLHYEEHPSIVFLLKCPFASRGGVCGVLFRGRRSAPCGSRRCSQPSTFDLDGIIVYSSCILILLSLAMAQSTSIEMGSGTYSSILMNSPIIVPSFLPYIATSQRIAQPPHASIGAYIFGAENSL